MSDDLDDLLGPEPKPEKPKRLGRPPKSKGPRPRSVGQSESLVVQRLQRPCSISLLSDILGMDRKTVTKRLSDLTPIGYHRGNVPLYDFRQAMQFLVSPKVDVAAYVRKMGVNDLPTALQKDVWDARLKEQKWKQQAGELWPTDAVLEVLGDTFARLKTTTQLWIDQIGEGHALSAAARQELTRMVDALQADLHRNLVEMPKERSTHSQLAEVPDDEGWAHG